MLTRSDQACIRANGQHTLHDYRSSSLIYGEPFLEDDLVFYFDGRALTVCGYPVGCEGSPAPSRIARFVLRLAAVISPESVMLITPVRADLRALSHLGYRRTGTWASREIHRELIARYPEGDASVPSHNLFRRALLAPFVPRTTLGGSMDAAKLKLVERFMKVTGVTPYTAALTVAWPALLTDRRVRFVEAWKDGVLVGFIAMHRAFERGAVAVAMARDPIYSRLSDYLYAQMLRESRKLDCDWVNICSSTSASQHAYKRKWAAESPLPAYSLTEWSLPRFARGYHSRWGPRTLKLGAPRVR